ncbi:MAG TPA: transcription antitermination factor NusB, partial [Armatimonadetes bacterium]|nr:transcription antitermination factor NusB [Armatimonadota bacterium]
MRRRHQARRIALQTLFQADVGGIPIEEAIATTLEDSRLPADVADFARTLVEGTWRHRDELDRFIQEHAPHWPLERMANVDRNILRIAVYEILYLHDIPYSVSINEAVELAKQFGS